MRVGQNWGWKGVVGVGLPGQRLIALMPLGPWLLLSILPPCVDVKFECAVYLAAAANEVLETATFTFVVLMTSVGP